MIQRSLAWLEKLSDEQHASQRLAARWHVGHAVIYGVLIGAYATAAIWHLGAARRHFRDARSQSAPSGQLKGAR